MSPTLVPEAIWQYIGMKLHGADRIRFCAVCKLWMSLIPQLPWLLLADFEEDRHESDTDSESEFEVEQVILESAPLPRPQPQPRGFVCLGEQDICQIDFPEIRNALAVGSSGNWVISAHRDQTIRLLNPFSRQQIYLPSQLAFERTVHPKGHRFRLLHLWKIILSSSPSNGPDCIAMASHHAHKFLAIARLGDPNWITVQGKDTDYEFCAIEGMIFYKGHFYAIDALGKLFRVDIGDSLNPPTASPITPFPIKLRGTKLRYNLYLVEWADELLLVIKWIQYLQRPHNSDHLLERPRKITHIYRTFDFQVYKFDFVNRNWDELKCLEKHSLFLGFNTSVSLRASDYFGFIKKNCIYFSDDYRWGYGLGGQKGGHDMGVFDLEDKSIQPHFRGVSTSFYFPPLWIVPT